MKKVLFFSVFALLTILTISGCGENIIVEERPTMVISREKVDYAEALQFEFQIIVDGEPIVSRWRAINTIIPGLELFDPFYNELVLVHSQADAAGFPDNVVVAWPLEHNPYFAQGLITGFHWAINRTLEDLTLPGRSNPRRDTLTLEEFGLSYPLSVADLVDNWEKLFALWNALERSEQNTIRRFGTAEGTGATADSNIDLGSEHVQPDD